ncbi:winged helix-turn-helix domain-containing protein [Pseudoalteromonas xiamenensis]|uniref:winged helix-turn-helix domain-containing protein n=1 Tax=Pseudoalteromonas xiamenensis TaxID=882626 RepID=UPI0027E514B5|nr:winged helix-turn-helix domain-containing protein [Pseudoalteromonas xiamenensis]WMN60753.1 winged helix-turn-helix domain-containing protein [Pseudoalteromonas xiamenensis]
MLDCFESEPKAHANNQQVNLRDGFWLNNVQVSPATGELICHGRQTRLEPKVMDVLVLLAHHEGQVVRAETIFEQVWPRAIFNPVSIRRAINQIRNALGDLEKDVLKTYPKRGYALHGVIKTIAVSHQRPQGGSLNEQVILNRTPAYLLYSLAVLLLCGVVGILFMATTSSSPKMPHVSNLRPISATLEDESFSLFTPDSNAIIYLREPENDKLGTQVWLSSLDRTISKLIWQSDEHIRYAAWVRPSLSGYKHQLLFVSQQGNELVFESLLMDSHYQKHAVQRHFTFDGTLGIGNVVVINDSVVFLSKETGVSALYRGNLRTGFVDKIYEPTNVFLPYRVANAEGSSTVAMVGFDEQHRSQIWLLDVQSKQVTTIATLDENWYFVTYSEATKGYLLSDGKRLRYLDNHNELSDIDFENYEFLHFPTMSTNGQHLSFTLKKINGNVFVRRFDEAHARPLTQSNRHSWLASFSPSGRHVAFNSNRNGFSQVFVKEIESGAERLIYANPTQQLALSQPVWNEDGSMLAFARNERLVMVRWQSDTPAIQYFDDVVGVPRYWSSEDNTLVFSRKGVQGQQWFEWSVSNHTEQVLGYLQPFLCYRSDLDTL